MHLFIPSLPIHPVYAYQSVNVQLCSELKLRWSPEAFSISLTPFTGHCSWTVSSIERCQTQCVCPGRPGQGQGPSPGQCWLVPLTLLVPGCKTCWWRGFKAGSNAVRSRLFWIRFHHVGGWELSIALSIEGSDHDRGCMRKVHNSHKFNSIWGCMRGTPLFFSFSRQK